MKRVVAKKPDLQASYLVSDEASINIVGGKYTLQGVYPADIIIPEDEVQIAQLVFFFQVLSFAEDAPDSFEVVISLPRVSKPYTLKVGSGSGSAPLRPGRDFRSARFPFAIIGPTLNSGEIVVELNYAGAKMKLPSTWILTAEENQFNRASTAAPQPS